MSDALVEKLWQLFLAACVMAFASWLSERTKRAVDKARKSAAEAAEAAEKAAKEVKGVKVAAASVKDDSVIIAASVVALTEATAKQDVKLEALQNVAVATHKLVNSEHGQALEAVAALSRWKAGQTGSARDAAAADNAEKMLEDHQGKQASVDRGDAKQG